MVYLSEAQLDEVTQGVHADSCTEKLYQLFKAESSLLTCYGKVVDGLF